MNLIIGVQRTTCRQCERAKAQGSAIKEHLSGLPPNCHIHISWYKSYHLSITDDSVTDNDCYSHPAALNNNNVNWLHLYH